MTEATGTFKLEIRVDPELRDVLGAALFDAGVGALEETPAGFCVYIASEEELSQMRAHLSALAFEWTKDTELSPLEFRTEHLPPTWEDVWKKALTPQPLTPQVTIRPTHAAPAPRGEKTLWFRPETSFGSGDHPTTRLAARALEQCAFEDPNRALLDVGCGNGVLSLLYVMQGGTRALGIDIDEAAVRSACHNAELNQKTDAVTFLKAQAHDITETFPLVVSNMNTHILLAEGQAIAQRLQKGATLILTGLLETDESEVISAFAGGGVRLQTRDREGEWSLLRFTR